MATKKSAAATSATPSPQHGDPGRPQPRHRPAPPGPEPARHRERRPQPAPAGERTPLPISARCRPCEPLRERLRARVIGQDEAIDALARAWARLVSGLRDPDRPLLTGLLLGPTGVGKTETARALAEALFGSPRALLRINCEEYSQAHEVARLLGSPPGYVGADVEPLLSQTRVDRAHAELRQPRGGDDAAEPRARSDALIEQVHDPELGLHSILLFDEIEKAHPTLWNVLLGVLEEGEITLGNNRTTSLTRSIILMTSNAGSREMSEALGRKQLGFAAEAATPGTASLAEIAARAARDLFPAEFLNRFDEVLAFRPLAGDALAAIFDKFLAEIAERTVQRAGVPLLLRISDDARQQVIAGGTDATLGARPLRRAMDRMLVGPLSRLMVAGKLVEGDVVDVELEDGSLAFYRLPREANEVVA